MSTIFLILKSLPVRFRKKYLITNEMKKNRQVLKKNVVSVPKVSPLSKKNFSSKRLSPLIRLSITMKPKIRLAIMINIMFGLSIGLLIKNVLSLGIIAERSLKL
jgi:hypothetical protein